MSNWGQFHSQLLVGTESLWAGSPRGTSRDWHRRSWAASFKRQRERMAGVWECNTSLYLLGRRTLTVFHYYFQKRTSGKPAEPAAFWAHNEPEFRGQNDNADGKVRGLTFLSQHKSCKLFESHVMNNDSAAMLSFLFLLHCPAMRFSSQDFLPLCLALSPFACLGSEEKKKERGKKKTYPTQLSLQEQTCL